MTHARELKTRGVGLIAVFVLCAGTALAQSPEPKRFYSQAGTWEFGGSLGFSSTTAVTDGATPQDAEIVLSATPSAGYFVIDGLAIVAHPISVVYASQGSTSDLDLLTLGGIGYAFRAHPRVFPFIEAVAGLSYSNHSATTTETRQGFAWGARGGVKFLITSTAIVNVGAEYTETTLNRSSETERNGENRIALLVGISFWL
jgi:hypothetical protein